MKRYLDGVMQISYFNYRDHLEKDITALDKHNFDDFERSYYEYSSVKEHINQASQWTTQKIKLIFKERILSCFIRPIDPVLLASIPTAEVNFAEIVPP